MVSEQMPKLQFSIRTVLMTTLLIAVLFSCLFLPAYHETIAVRQIERLGGKRYFSSEVQMSKTQWSVVDDSVVFGRRTPISLWWKATTDKIVIVVLLKSDMTEIEKRRVQRGTPHAGCVVIQEEPYNVQAEKVVRSIFPDADVSFLR